MIKRNHVLKYQGPLSPKFDPWDPINSLTKWGDHQLTSVEFTMTQLCNMRCEHCAVGDTLSMTEGPRLPLALIFKRLDEVEHLQTISITGGEPTLHEHTVRQYIIPILKYARQRGIYTQLNSNLTMEFSRYERIAEFLDVMHISYNYRDARDFYEVGFVHRHVPMNESISMRMFEQMKINALNLSQAGCLVSAESMINFRTYQHLSQIHRDIVEMGCFRHEVHPMYPSAFASDLPMISLSDMRSAVHELLDHRQPDMWMLFGTLPFFACESSEEDQKLIRRLRNDPHVTVRNDPDGRNRLNVNIFTGNVYVTDFADIPSLGNLQHQRLDDVFITWKNHPLYHQVNCFCPTAQCCGPNLLVKSMYYPDLDFKKRIAIV